MLNLNARVIIDAAKGHLSKERQELGIFAKTNDVAIAILNILTMKPVH